jgi:hypothetical protein
MTHPYTHSDRVALALDNDQRLMTDGGEVVETALPTDEMGVSGRQADALEDAFESTDEIVDYLTDGGSVSDYDGIGSTTSRRVMDWFEQAYPIAHRERRENDEGICTEYYDGDGRADDGSYLWGFVCPRCESENPLKGDPAGFRGRPYACMTCNWVSLLEGESIDEFVDEVDPEIETPEVATDGGESVGHEIPDDFPAPPESEHTLHVFDTRDFDRTETLLEVQIGDTRKEAQSNITDKESTAPAFEDAEQTANGNHRGADLSKPMHATLEADESYPSLVYLGTLSEAAPHLFRLLAASERKRSRWSVVTPTAVDANIGEWVGELYDLANDANQEVATDGGTPTIYTTFVDNAGFRHGEWAFEEVDTARETIEKYVDHRYDVELGDCSIDDASGHHFLETDADGLSVGIHVREIHDSVDSVMEPVRKNDDGKESEVAA